MKNRSFLILLTFALLLFGLAMPGCAEEQPEQPLVAPTVVTQNADHKIEALVAVGSEVRTLTFRANAETQPKADAERGLAAKDYTTEAGDLAARASSVSDLARMAFSECGMRHLIGISDTAFDSKKQYSCPSAQFISGTPWFFRPSVIPWAGGAAALPMSAADNTNKLSCGYENPNLPATPAQPLTIGSMVT